MSRFATTATKFLTDGDDSPNWGALGRVQAAADALRDQTELQTAIRRDIGDMQYEGAQELMKLGGQTQSFLNNSADKIGLANTIGQIGSSIGGALGSNLFSKPAAPTPGTPSFGYDEVSFGRISDPTADIQRALGPGVPFGMYDNSFR